MAYEMDINLDVNTHQYTGKQKLTYYNNSPETLKRVFYHLYFNAFQPNSMMDVRSRTIKDADPRVADRIFQLKKEEQGFYNIKSLKQNGQPLKFEVAETILEVALAEPIAPGKSAVFEMEFMAQVPVQVRRSGRDSNEGIAYTMTQWYPKMCEYDYMGWHANPYIGREFYGVWGDYDVKITLDKSYIIGGTGNLQNPDEIGYGYSGKTDKPTSNGKTATWHFVAQNVHDFAWGADPDYTHTTLDMDEGFTLHFFYQKNEKTEENWEKLPKAMQAAYQFIKTHYGTYPYRQYSFVQGGDGGMEYPMCTLITGERNYPSLVGVSVHEWMHTWYQMLMGTNESLYAWMDEGFTSYSTAEVMNQLKKDGIVPGDPVADPHLGEVEGYIRFALSGQEEPLSTHADHFQTNTAYGVGSYVKGSVFLQQLQYIVGKRTFDKALLDYFDKWHFRHPNDNDIIRIFELASDLELDWFREYFVNTTHTIDYAVKSVEQDGKKTKITLERTGLMPMPLDITVTEKNGKKTIYNIPLQIMRGAKPQEDTAADYEVASDWPWTNPTYELTIDCPFKKVTKVEIDASRRMADAKRDNNTYEKGD